MSEEALAAKVVLWLRRQGWEVFKEVLCPKKKRIVDIYARRKQGGSYETWAIEVKTSFGLSVMEQASYWDRYAHQVSIAVPPSKKRRSRAFGYKLCQILGLGVIQVSGRSVRVAQTPRRYPNPIIPRLVEDQKKFAAGNAKGQYWKPLDQTLKELGDYAAANPGCLLAEAVPAINHHYRSNKSAHRVLLRHLTRGKGRGIVRYRQTAKGVVLNP